MFDIDRKRKVEPVIILRCKFWVLFLCPSLLLNNTHAAKEIDDDRNPDQT